MRSIVLVGGEGTRLRPLTSHTPKALVPVLNRPLLTYLLRHLRAHGVTSVTLAMTKRSRAIEDTLAAEDNLDLQLRYVYEDTPLGSGGAIAAAAAGWDEPFLVCNGDIVTDLDVSALVRSHRERGAELSISLHEVDDPSRFGVAALDATGRIERFVEKPPRDEAPSKLINSGVWLFEPQLLAEMDATSFNRVEDGLFPALAAAGRNIVGHHDQSYWVDVGTPEAYLQVNLDMLAGQAGAGRQATSHLSDDVQVASTAALARVVAGHGCAIGERATVRESVLWEDVTIEAGASVERSVLASGCTVGAGAVLREAIVAQGANVPAGAQPPAGARIEAEPHHEPRIAATSGA